MKNIDLCPCPFCREPVDWFCYGPPLSFSGLPEYVVECHNPDCIAWGRVWPRYDSPEEAATAWNAPNSKRRLAALIERSDFEKRIRRR